MLNSFFIRGRGCNLQRELPLKTHRLFLQSSSELMSLKSSNTQQNRSKCFRLSPVCPVSPLEEKKRVLAVQLTPPIHLKKLFRLEDIPFKRNFSPLCVASRRRCQTASSLQAVGIRERHSGGNQTHFLCSFFIRNTRIFGRFRFVSALRGSQTSSRHKKHPEASI